MCACWERPRKTLRGNSRRLNQVWELYFGENKVAKGVCNVAKLATLYFSISPTTGAQPVVKQKITAALITR